MTAVQFEATVDVRLDGGAVAIADSAELLESAVDVLHLAGVRVRILADDLSDEALISGIGDARVVLIGLRKFDRSLINRLENPGLLVRCGVGVDVVDVIAATDRGIWVSNIPDYCVSEVADHTLLLILAACRYARLFHQQVIIGEHWRSDVLPSVKRIRGRTLGLVGLGRIGSEVGLRARAFGMRVIASDPYATPSRFRRVGAETVSLPELLASADIISLHVPLTAKTRHLLDDRAFSTMRAGTIIVNTSRGGLVDLAALDRALEMGIVGAAGLDVVEGEPNPDLSHPLFARFNVFVTPHVAWYSMEARTELGVRAAEDAIRFLAGKRPRSLVNPMTKQSRRSAPLISASHMTSRPASAVGRRR
jgi:D-3-phosphoglycerate dehydrogenase